MNSGCGPKDPHLQALVARLSAMSADQFNACVRERAQYQADLNDWIAYADEVDFAADDGNALPDAEDHFRFDSSELKRFRQALTRALNAAKKKGVPFDEMGLRQDTFTDALYRDLIAALRAEHGVSARMYDDVAEMDEAASHGEAQWEWVQGGGKDLFAAGRTSTVG